MTTSPESGSAALPRPSDLSWKYRTRLALVPLLGKLGRSVGFEWETLGRMLGPEVLIAQIESTKPSKVLPQTKNSLDVVFLTMIGGHAHNVSVEVVLARALQARGHRVSFVVCDQGLPVCEVKRAGREDDWPRACAKCWSFGRRYVTAAGFRVIPLRRLVSEPPASSARWDDIVDSALLKHYRRGLIDDDPQTQERRRTFSRAAAISAEAGKRIGAMRPDRVLMSHGIYCTWGPAFEVLREAGIPVITYAKGKTKSTEKFNWSSTGDWWDVSEEWERVKGEPLTPSEEETLDQYLESRRDHRHDALRYNFTQQESRREIRERLALPDDCRTYVMFTNVLWDAASAKRELVFSSPIDWVVETVDWFGENPDRQLLIRVHPAEKVIGTNQPFAQVLHSIRPNLPNNIRVVPPEEDINSWSLVGAADIGIVHTSTVGLELALEGVPCIVVSRTHYRGRGFTVDAESKRQYFDLLKNFEPLDDYIHSARELARRYAFLLFHRYQIPWNVFYEMAHTDVRALRPPENDGSFLKDPWIQLITHAIEQGTPFLVPRASECGGTEAFR